MRNIHARWPCLAVVLVCAFATGCVRPVYGDSWAKQVKVDSETCPVIDGDYQNTGERFDSYTHSRQTVSLTYVLNGWNDAEGDQADDQPGRTSPDVVLAGYQTVSLRLAENKLHVVASYADGSTRTFDLPTQQRCRDSTLFLAAAWDGDTTLSVSGVGRTTLAMGRAEDGSLLVRERTTAVAFFLWVPVFAGSIADWTIFPPVAPAPDQMSALTP